MGGEVKTLVYCKGWRRKTLEAISVGKAVWCGSGCD